MGVTREKLRRIGIETLGIVASPVERARLYFRFHPVNVSLGADAEMATHRLYGLPSPPATPELVRRLSSLYVGLAREMSLSLPETSQHFEVAKAVARGDGFEVLDTDPHVQVGHPTQLVGQFLVDQHGIVRWTNIEGAVEGVVGAGKFPSDEELVAAAQALPA